MVTSLDNLLYAFSYDVFHKLTALMMAVGFFILNH